MLERSRFENREAKDAGSGCADALGIPRIGTPPCPDQHPIGTQRGGGADDIPKISRIGEIDGNHEIPRHFQKLGAWFGSRGTFRHGVDAPVELVAALGGDGIRIDLTDPDAVRTDYLRGGGVTAYFDNDFLDGDGGAEQALDGPPAFDDDRLVAQWCDSLALR